MISRRSFIAGTVVLAACAKNDPPPSLTSAPVKGGIPTNVLGRTGETISRIGIGGSHLGETHTEDEAIRIVRSAIDHGVTFMDNSWDYHGGDSERRMGKALEGGWRQRAFLMTKVDGRDKDSAQKQLEQSLQRLRTDHIDLVQIHEVIRSSDPTAVFAPGGAIEGLLEARKAGKLRFIGFTGHKDPSIHLEMLAVAEQHGFTFDTIMMPLNVMDAHFRSFQHNVLPVARRKGLGICSMKPIGSGDLLKSKTVTAVECLQYALSLPTNVVITGCDSMPILNQAIHVAQNFKPLDEDQIADLLRRTRDAALSGKYELFKTADKYDSTASHPKWLHSAEI
ncbi:MAG TPA: aldo/keto reductase [Polyangiaceae bacterium]|jgi:predicted aldo/keto reductase-like oxidoreductase